MSQGKCTQVIPYTPIITSPVMDDYYYYSSLFSREKVALLTRFEYKDFRSIIDEYLIQDGGFDSYTRNLVNSVFDAVVANPASGFDKGSLIDARASLRSPVNIDRSAISNETIEGAKFNSTYDALTKSPAFQKLFVDLFDNSKRFNVKFKIEEHVYEDNNSSKKEINATTSQDPTSNNITIKISKQILIPGSGKSQTTIENAKTILHECIHAYLFVKAKNPAAGVDFVKTLNTIYPSPDEQHDFMYNKMIPTMQKVLSEIRDFVTTQRGRDVLENEVTMHPTEIPLTSTPWIWNEYYRYISLKGLEETIDFKKDFPNPSDKLRLFNDYYRNGHNELDR